MSEVSATAAFKVTTDNFGTRRIEGRRTWLGLQHGWTQDGTNHSVYQLLGDLAPSDRDTVPKLPLLNVITCSAKTPSGREMVTQGLEDEQTVLIDWSRAKSGQLQFGSPRLKGPGDKFPAPSAADLRLAVHEPSFAEYNNWVSGERAANSFSLQITRMKTTDPGYKAMNKGLGGNYCPVRVKVEPVARYDDQTVAWVTEHAEAKKACEPLSRFGSFEILQRSMDKISYEGGMSIVKQEDSEWIRYKAPNMGHHQVYWSRFDAAKDWTQFGVFPSDFKAFEVFGRPGWKRITEKMTDTSPALSVKRSYKSGDGGDVEDIVHLSRTPEGLMCSESAEGTITDPFPDHGVVKFRKDLPWTPEEELLVVLAGRRIS